MSVGLETKYYSFVFDSGNIIILKVTEIHDVIMMHCACRNSPVRFYVKTWTLHSNQIVYQSYKCSACMDRYIEGCSEIAPGQVEKIVKF